MVTFERARKWYPEADPVHGFDHVLRVYHLAERLAQAEGADLEIVRAAALLHDAIGLENGGQPDARRSHHQASAGFAVQILESEGWEPERIAAVQHCIRAHRFRDNSEPPASLEARVLFDADKLDAVGATGVARAVAYAARDGCPAYAPPSERFLQSGEREPGEAHSSYHEFLFKLSRLQERLFTPTARSVAAERHRFMTEFDERLIREASGEA